MGLKFRFTHRQIFMYYIVIQDLWPVESTNVGTSIGSVCVLVAQSCLTLCDPHGLEPTRLLCPGNSPGKNTGVGYHFLLQEIFPTQGSNQYLFISPALTGGFFTTSATWEAPNMYMDKSNTFNFKKQNAYAHLSFLH